MPLGSRRHSILNYLLMSPGCESWSGWQIFRVPCCGLLPMEITDIVHALVLFLFASVPLHHSFWSREACLAHRRVTLFNQQPLFVKATWSWHVLLVKYAFCSFTLRLLSALLRAVHSPNKASLFLSFLYLFHFIRVVSSLNLRKTLF